MYITGERKSKAWKEKEDVVVDMYECRVGLRIFFTILNGEKDSKH